MEGWIKLHRCLADSYVFSNPTTLKIWIWILIKASSKKRTVSLKIGTGFHDIDINPGELIFGRFKAEEDLNIDGSTIYKHIKKLEDSKNIELKSNNHFTIITVCNWETYQENENEKEQPENNRVTAREQQSNNRVTTEEHKQESKEGKESKERIYSSDTNFLMNFSKAYFQEKYLTDGVKDLFEKLLKEYSKETIQEVIKFGRTDSFWQKNFISPKKLDKKDKSDVKYIDVFIAKLPKSDNKPTPTTQKSTEYFKTMFEQGA